MSPTPSAPSSSADESRSYMWEGQDRAISVLHRQSLRVDAASGLLGRISSYKRFFPSVSLVLVILLASWMGNANGGYFVGEWSLVAFFLAVLL